MSSSKPFRDIEHKSGGIRFDPFGINFYPLAERAPAHKFHDYCTVVIEYIVDCNNIRMLQAAWDTKLANFVECRCCTTIKLLDGDDTAHCGIDALVDDAVAAVPDLGLNHVSINA